jgi:hypothetical protein
MHPRPATRSPVAAQPRREFCESPRAARSTMSRQRCGDIGAGYVGGSGRPSILGLRHGWANRGTRLTGPTKAAEIYKKTGNLRAAQLCLHTRSESTVRYLGIEVALSISEQVELKRMSPPCRRACVTIANGFAVGCSHTAGEVAPCC